MVIITGLMILGGGLSVLLGLWMEIGTWLLVFFLVPVAIKMHDFWAVTDPLQKSVQQAHFMKNIAMAGAALILYWVVQSYGYGPFTLGEPM
jgi:putative oxidoreductase